ncbi:MAG: flagellar hook-associated protein 2 [Massilia sp.]|jgi:flagellar hook-associated protein 2
MASIGTNYDPATTAQALAESFTSARQQILTRQSTAASATEKALTTLSSALSAFQSSLASLTGLNKTISANSATFSDTAVASASATATAAAGTYSFFVQQVATAHKVSYSGMTDFAGQGTLTLGAGTNSFTLDLSTKANWTVRDLAAAINGATGNTSLSASVVTTGTTSELVLTATATGAANTISVVASNDADAPLQTKITAGPTVLTAAQDAIVRIGSATGTEIRQASNTLNVIDGVTMTLTKAQAAGSAPVTLTVASDSSKTTANAQAFVDAYNKMKASIDALVTPGDPSEGDAAGAFAGDSGVRALRDRMVNLLRNGTGGASLATFGIIANREGQLTLDSTRLTKALAANPTGLDTLIGSSATTAPSGIAGKLDTYLKLWTNSANGQINSRKDAVGKLQLDLTDRQTALDRQYDSAYARYLAQFTQLQSVQSSMSYNTSLFDALFSSDKD